MKFILELNTFGRWGDHVHGHGSGSGSVAHQSDEFWIATEFSDIGLHPAQGQILIPQT